MTDSDTFDVLMLLARPAAGKSEIIDYLKRIDLETRACRFHIGALVEIDDFPMLWTWFEEDALLDEMGRSRLHTGMDGYFTGHYLWQLLIRRMDLEYHKRLRDLPPGEKTTVLIEFSRGKEHGGYAASLPNFSSDLLAKAAILYVQVSWEESLRKNRRRFNPNRQDSILEHGLSDEKMERLYRETDWDELATGKVGRIPVNGIQVPFAVFDNEDDVTTGRGEPLGSRLETVLQSLWSIYRSPVRSRQE